MAKRKRRKAISAKSRRKHGSRGGKLRKGSFPVMSERTAMSAIRLRGHGKSKKAVLDKVSRWASRTGNARIKAAVKRARKRDRKR